VLDVGNAVVTGMGIGVAYRCQDADDQRITVSIGVELRRRRESQKYSQESGEQTCMECNRPMAEAHDVGPTPRHAGHARAGRLPEALDKQPEAALPLCWHDVFRSKAVNGWSALGIDGEASSLVTGVLSLSRMR